MIYIRLIYCAFILLVLLFVGSAMGVGDEPYRFFASEAQSEICLSLRHRKNLTACCNKNDPMQKIQVTTTGISEGIFHSLGGDRILCYDTRKGRFKSKRRSSFKQIDHCRHMKSRQGHRHKSKSTHHRRSLECPFSSKDKEFFKNSKGNLKCVFHETLGSGYTYISVEPNAKYLAVKKGRVQKLKKNRKTVEPKEKFKRFLSIGQNDISIISGANRICSAR